MLARAKAHQNEQILTIVTKLEGGPSERCCLCGGSSRHFAIALDVTSPPVLSSGTALVEFRTVA